MRHPLSPALLFALAFAVAAPVLPQAAHAQAGACAYAPEDLWTLSVADQTRVISQEYREQSNGRTLPNDQLRFYLDQVRLSRWTFSKVKQDIAKSLGGNTGPTPRLRKPSAARATTAANASATPRGPGNPRCPGNCPMPPARKAGPGSPRPAG